MKSINIVECKNEDDLKEVAILAEKIWHEFFPGIISEAQIDYMVKQFQSFDAMQDQVKHQQYHYHNLWLTTNVASLLCSRTYFLLHYQPTSVAQ